MKIKPYTGKAEKRYTAEFKDGKKIHFGQKGGSTYIDHKDKDKRKAYIARHSKAGENWNNPKTPGALSKHLLWGDHTTLKDNLKSFIQKFNL